MKVNEIFESIQGEGPHAGQPALFIRLSGCTRACDFCDTKYHTTGKEMTTTKIANRIDKSGYDIVIWTGGEPILQEEEIRKVWSKLNPWEHKSFHLETNGDILPHSTIFSYISFSPKNERVAKNVSAYVGCLDSCSTDWDIKVVTDTIMNKEFIKYATILMPLTTGLENTDKVIQRKVWEYCMKNKIRYSPRLHREVWDNKRGV